MGLDTEKRRWRLERVGSTPGAAMTINLAAQHHGNRKAKEPKHIQTYKNESKTHLAGKLIGLLSGPSRTNIGVEPRSRILVILLSSPFFNDSTVLPSCTEGKDPIKSSVPKIWFQQHRCPYQESERPGHRRPRHGGHVIGCSKSVWHRLPSCSWWSPKFGSPRSKHLGCADVPQPPKQPYSANPGFACESKRVSHKVLHRLTSVHLQGYDCSWQTIKSCPKLPNP